MPAVLGSQPERPVCRVRHCHHQPARLLAAREHIVEHARLADARLTREHQALLLAEGALTLPAQQLVAHLEAALAHHHRRALKPARAILYRAAAEADVVEELEERGTRLELEELADVVGRVLQRVVARTEELRRLDGHAAALHRSRLPFNLFLCEQHVASGRRRPRLELDLGCNV